MIKKNKIIYALASPPGKSALAIIRISGPGCFQKIKKISLNMPTKPNTATINKIKSSDNKIIDKSITTFFKSPKSYTGEDMVEISIHGGNAVKNKIIRTLNKIENFKIAKAGEFTRRAFENNKLDLIQVEAIADIVDSETESQRDQAYKQLSGELTKTFSSLSNQLLTVLANIEAIIDFSEEDLPKNLKNKIKEQIENIIKDIKHQIVLGERGTKIRKGFIVSIIGNPNTGKSSFINKLSQRDIAIVTKEPGTTRDLIETFFDIKGLPIRLFDTAGLRKPKNNIEKIGIEKTKEIMNLSDLCLVFINKKKDIEKYKKIKKAIFVKSKQDIQRVKKEKGQFINISSKTGYGIELLLNKIYKIISKIGYGEDPSVSRERHCDSLKKALNHLEKSKNKKNIDVFAEDIRLAMNEISKITGNNDIEDILDIIFNEFCIGK